MFEKSDRRRRSAAFTLTVGALAAIGTIGIVRGVKRMARTLAERVKCVRAIDE